MAQQLTKRSVRKLRAVVRAHDRRPRNPAGPAKRAPRLNRQLNHLVQTNAAHAINAMGTCRIYTGEPGSETDSGRTIQAYNKFATLAINKWGWVSWNGFGWYLTAGKCS